MFKLIPNAVWKVIQDELEAKRDDIRRLTEAIARQSGSPVQLSKDIISTLPTDYIPSQGWFDKKPIPGNPPRKDPSQ